MAKTLTPKTHVYLCDDCDKQFEGHAGTTSCTHCGSDEFTTLENRAPVPAPDATPEIAL